MSTWVLEPRDTLVARDGRPLMENAPTMRSLEVPWPSSLAGLVRSRIGAALGGDFNARMIALLKSIRVTGPWLVELDDAGEIVEHWFRAPTDVVWFGRQRFRLSPRKLAADEVCDWGRREIVAPVAALPDEKPNPKPPMFWRWAEIRSWLEAPPVHDRVQDDFGRSRLLHERRVHAAIEPKSGTVVEGAIFGTDGLRFVDEANDAWRRWGLGFGCDDPRMSGGPCFLGGERRISFLRAPERVQPIAPPALAATAQRVRVLLLTPAIFEEGASPSSIAGAPVVAAAVGRPEVVSGWDMAVDEKHPKSRPKRSRRMAPAGSVYWVEITGDVEAWRRKVSMTCISSEEQDRIDGFGLAVVGRA